MNAENLIKSIQHFHRNILSRALCSSAWVEETITNAFLWAEFCEQIHKKCAGNAEIMKSLDDQMHHFIGSNTGVFCCFKNLRQSSLLLCQAFLQNPSIEENFLKDIVQKVKPDSLDFEEASSDASSMDSLCLELLESLKPISISNSDRCLYREIKTELLLDFLKDVVAQLDTEDQSESHLSFIFETLCGDEETISVIFDILGTEDASETVSEIQGFLLHWILLKLLDDENGPLACFLWKQHPSRLRGIAEKYSSFGSYYVDFLTRCASSLSLEYENCTKCWKKSSSSHPVRLEFEEIVGHFRRLLSEEDGLCNSVREHLRRLLTQQPQTSIWEDISSCVQP